MKFEVGMYCYDKTNRNFGIGKITGEEENQKYIIRYKNRMTLVPIGNIIASHSIIDLIEVGDYVNGYKVIGFEETYFNGLDRKKEPMRIEVIIDNGKFEYEKHIKKEDIKTILTKEQFENNCYRE